MPFNPRPDSMRRALHAAERAIDANPGSQMANYAYVVAQYFGGDLGAFRAAAGRALALNLRKLAPLSIGSARGTITFQPKLGLESFPASSPALKLPRRNKLPEATVEEAQAIRMLSRAAHDMRRFHTAISGVERQLFFEAYSWIRADDFSRSSSFVNVCQSLSADCERMRTELLADVSLGWLGYWSGLSERLLRLLRDSLARLFACSRKANDPESPFSVQETSIGGQAPAINTKKKEKTDE